MQPSKQNPQVDGDSAPNKRRIAARLGKLFSARARSPSPLTGSPTPPLSPRYKESSSSLFVYNTPPRSPTKTPPPVAAPNGARKKVVQFRRRLSETSPEEVEERRAGIVRSQTEVFTFDRPANRRLVDRQCDPTDLLECPVCNERFNRPKMLPCQHTFCVKCLRDQITYSRGRVNNVLQCPLCQLQVKLKIRFVEELEAALDSLPSNLYIDSLLAVLRNESPQQQPVQEPEVRCSKCQTVCSARICNHCKQNFCGVCWPSHMTVAARSAGRTSGTVEGRQGPTGASSGGLQGEETLL
uniref:RING-type domain-containing protein n=1 Tax=Timema bartmani TaxID=61472 RepID=A0A7R9I6S5_9NEOP|nr:unnamed protein product [Timema bartmani]